MRLPSLLWPLNLQASALKGLCHAKNTLSVNTAYVAPLGLQYGPRFSFSFFLLRFFLIFIPPYETGLKIVVPNY